MRRALARGRAQAQEALLRRDPPAAAAFATDAPGDGKPARARSSDRASSGREASSSGAQQPVSRLFAGLKTPEPGQGQPRRPSRPGYNRPRFGGRPGDNFQRGPGDQRLPPHASRPRGPQQMAGSGSDDLEDADPAGQRQQQRRRLDRRPARETGPAGRRRFGPPGERGGQQHQLGRPRSSSPRPPRPRRPRMPSLQSGASPLEVQHAQDVERYQLGPGEPMALLEPASLARIRSWADLPVYTQHEAAEAARAQLMEVDPEVNLCWGMPRRRRLPGAAELVDARREQLMAVNELSSEEEWQALRPRAVRALTQLRLQMHVRDVQAEQAVLEGLRDSVPLGHPLRAHVDMTVHQLGRNPWWPFAAKEQMVRSLVTQYAR